MNPKVEILLSNDKKIKLELYPEIAPITVENFLKLVDSKYYDGVVFHRIIDNFMIQTGGYKIEGNNLIEKETSKIKGEFLQNGVINNLKHEIGVISMARTSDPNSASGQFFICSANTPHLDGSYAAFGKCIDKESIDNVLEVSKTETMNIGYGLTDFPTNLISIKTILRN